MSARIAATAHLAVASAASVLLAIALPAAARAGRFESEGLRDIFTTIVPLASLGASFVVALQGWLGRRPRGLFEYDAATTAVLLGTIAAARFLPMSNDLTGVLLAATLAARLAPVVVDVVLHGASPAGAPSPGSAVVPFAAALVAYGALGAWEHPRMLPQGDQPHTLMAAEALEHATFDMRAGYGDGTLFAAISGQPLSAVDLAGHVVTLAGADRLIQGYGLALLVLPGWILAGVLGAKLTLAVVGAATSALTYLLVREVAGDGRPARLAWALSSFLVPLLSFATLVYSSVVGAALLAAAFRWLFSAPVRRPALAAVAIALTLLLTPRDGLSALLLVPLVAWLERPFLRRFAVALLVALAGTAAFSFVAYGVPLPYVGYLAVVGGGRPPYDEPLLWTRVDLALPGILFDRAFGLAGSAPWVFSGLLGVIPLVRERRPAVRAALAVVLGTLAALSFYRAWQAGWAPPNRYLVALLPLWAPFVAAGLAVAWRSLAGRIASLALVTLSVLATVTLAADPGLGYTLDEVRWTAWLAERLGANPLGWLPSLAVDDSSSFYLRSLAATALLALLTVLGIRRASSASGP